MSKVATVKITHSQHSKPLDGLPHEDSPECPCGPLYAQEGSCAHFRHQTRWPDGSHHILELAQAHVAELEKVQSRTSR